MYCSFFFFNDTATTEIYTLSLHDALPIYDRSSRRSRAALWVLSLQSPARTPRSAVSISVAVWKRSARSGAHALHRRSEEHTSELQSRQYLVCRLLLEKKKKQK